MLHRFFAVVAATFVFVEPVTSAESSLEQGFFAPPSPAKPAIWWYWGESVTTDHGITQDLEALKRVGFGGVVLYEQVFTDRPGALKSLSPAWLARVRFAAAECARLGLTLEVNAGNGYVAGGPWITPELGMQRLVATETVVTGGQAPALTLPQPETKLNYYRDVAVLAYPTPAGDGELPAPVVTGDVTGAQLKQLFSTDGRTKLRMPSGTSAKPLSVKLDYGRPVTARSISYSARVNLKALVIATQMPTSWADDFLGQGMKPIPPLGSLEASDDGAAWRPVGELPGLGTQHDSWTQRTVSFSATTARYFRLNLSPVREELSVGGVELRGAARLDWWESKAGNIVDFSNPDRTPNYSGDEVIDPDKVLDLTSLFRPGGKLAWAPPPGRWTILRLGHTATGATTKHGRPETLGLECDKLSAAAAGVQFSNYVGIILREIRQVPGARLAGVNMDSAEHGSQNWTADFPEQFEKRRGYSLLKFLPAMMGRVVGSREVSDKFLFDVRRTIADLMSDEYFGAFQKLCHAEGMTLMAQAPGIATCLPSDNIQAKGRTDMPMAEFWMSQPDGTLDCRETASAAHVYGRPVAAAESFTGSRPEVYPGLLKPYADVALAQGINRFVALAYVHQPWDDKLPGVTEDRFFLPLQRHNTWWENSGDFWASLARASQLMRAGLPVAGILYDLGSDTPLKIATSRMRPVPPAGYNYDVCGDEALITRASVKNGRIVLPDGVSYSLLILAGGDKMTLSAARKIKALVIGGAAVLGPIKPTGSPSLGDGPGGDQEVRDIANELWGDHGQPNRGDRRTGLGRMLWGMKPAEALALLAEPRDWELVGDTTAANLLVAHRTTAQADIYFVVNHQPRGRNIRVNFRVTGRMPERWDADTGTIAKITDWHEVNGQTQVPLALEANASTFVVFHADTHPSVTLKCAETNLISEIPVRAQLTGPWTVHFTPGWGAPPEVVFTNLISWGEFPDAGVRGYSGSATYTKEFQFAKPRAGERVLLDLGQVAVLASVKLNGFELGVAWKEPAVFDVGTALRLGTNQLEICVQNTWVNRLIADAALPPDKRLTWATYNPYHAGDVAPPSGLLGPVLLRSATGSFEQ